MVTISSYNDTHGIFRTSPLPSIQLYIGLDSSVNWLLTSLTLGAFLHIVESSAYI